MKTAIANDTQMEMGAVVCSTALYLLISWICKICNVCNSSGGKYDRKHIAHSGVHNEQVTQKNAAIPYTAS